MLIKPSETEKMVEFTSPYHPLYYRLIKIYQKIIYAILQSFTQNAPLVFALIFPFLKIIFP